MQKYITKSEQETIDLGKTVGQSLIGGELLLLVGDLGGGKTHFTKGIASALGISGMVISPTFTIERIYSGESLELHHFDLYRILNDVEILAEIKDLIQDRKNVVVVEWPESIVSLANIKHRKISFKYLDDQTRELIISEGDEV